MKFKIEIDTDNAAFLKWKAAKWRVSLAGLSGPLRKQAARASPITPSACSTLTVTRSGLPWLRTNDDTELLLKMVSYLKRPNQSWQ